MPETPRPKIFRYARFNLQALLGLAQKLRGLPCTCDEAQSPKAGSLNWVIFITFDDGIQWVFRSPRHDTSMFTDETASKMIVSEASTLRYLEAHCPIPVPKVYSYSGTGENAIGVPYMLQSKARGRPLSDYRWTEPSIGPPGLACPVTQLPLSHLDRQEIMKQLGVIMSRLSRVQFDKIGSIFEDDNKIFCVRECLSPVLTWQSRDCLEAEIDRGPFSSEDDYLRSLTKAFRSLAEELPLAPYFFFSPLPKPVDYLSWESYKSAVDRRSDFVVVGDKLEGSKNRFSYCIAGQLLDDMVPVVLSEATDFTMSHPDLHVGNVFVDEALNITCIIDWGSTTTGPVTELLATPGLAGSSKPPSSQLIAAFRAGFLQKSPDVDLHMWRKAEMMWCFSRLVRLLSGQDFALFQKLYELVHESDPDVISNSVDDGRLFQGRAMSASNKELLLGLREDDLPGEEVRAIEDEVFRDTDTDRLAIARKLTLMSEMSPGFLGDARLWRWLEDALVNSA